MNLTTVEVAEYDLSPRQQAEILSLLDVSFPGFFTDKIFFKQMPKERFLTYFGSELVGHLGLEHRAVMVGEHIATVFGVMDLCVRPDFRSRRIATALLERMEAKAKAAKINFCLLFSEKHKLFLQQGYSLCANECIWLGIEEKRTLGVLKSPLSDCMMVKRISGDIPWDDSLLVDLLGYLF